MADDPRSRRARRIRRWLSQPPPRDTIDVFTYLFNILGDVAIEIAERPRPLRLDVLTFDEVIRYFVDERPDDSQVHHGVLLAHRGSSAEVPCLQLFVDRGNQPCLTPSGAPHGRLMLVRRLDRELRNMLGGRELIIFE